MRYDIFISYRREGGYDTAKHLNDLLVRDHYKVSFDIDTLRSGDFDIQLLTRVEECKDFILIVDKHAFDWTLDENTVPEQDWLRQELAHALKHKKNIIPVFLSGVSGFPEGLPEDIRGVVKKNGPEFNKYYFDDFYAKLKKRFLKSRNHKVWYWAFIGLFLALIASFILFPKVGSEEEVIYQNFHMPHIATENELKEYAIEYVEESFEKAEVADTLQYFKSLQINAQEGDPESQYCLGLCYFYGKYSTRSLSKAMKWVEKSTDQNHAPAEYFLATCYVNGFEVQTDLEVAEQLYRKAAESGYALAQNAMGVMCNSYGKFNPKESVEWFRKSAEQNCAPAQYNLCYCIYSGISASPDIEEFIYWLEKSAAQGYILSRYNLALFYITGPENYKDVDKGLGRLEELVSEGYAPALYNLAEYYANESLSGIDKDLDKTVEFLEEAAKKKFAPALTNLGYAYINPNEFPIEQNIEKGFDYLLEAAQQGYPLAEYYLGVIYQNGMGKIKRDAAEAQKWFDKAARQGVTHQTVQNMNNQNNSNNRWN